MKLLAEIAEGLMIVFFTLVTLLAVWLVREFNLPGEQYIIAFATAAALCTLAWVALLTLSERNRRRRG